MKDIDEFENTYKPEFSIQWYKRDSLMCRILNKVMRQQNIQGILLLRFFILDLFNQLSQVYHEFIDSDAYEDGSYIHIYRGQLMFAKELDCLKKNWTSDRIISVSSFFSTSREQDVALIFSGAVNPDHAIVTFSNRVKPILFEIKIKINHKMKLKWKPFADIGYILNNGELDKPGELEVLFMAGSFFQVNEIIENKEIEIPNDEQKIIVTVTLIKLTLINEDDLNIPIINDYQILKSTRTIEGKLIRLGNLLVDHSVLIQSSQSKVETYYKALSNEPKLMMTTACLTGQAWMAFKREQYDLAIQLALEALSIDDKSNEELTITTLNCLGGIYEKLKNYPNALKYYTKAYNLSKPTNDWIANKKYHGPCIPIDKYAMYDNYGNISIIKIACICQKIGNTQLAWDMYKEAIDYEMRNSTDFHCHTCMTIAESGTHETITTPEEHNRIWKNWKSFLDLGLNDMLQYRIPVMTGYLSSSHQYGFPSRRYNNNHCRSMAIDYFRKAERHCIPYVANHDYYLYILQCYERLAKLYQHWNTRSIEYYKKIIQLCLKYHPDDLENIIIGYKGMIETYRQQQLRTQDNSEDILIKLYTDTDDIGITSSRISIPLPMFGSFFQNTNPLDCAFDCYDKWIDSRLENEADFCKKIIYYHMKLAALYYDQEKIIDAENSLIEAKLLCQQYGSEMANVVRLCDENLSYIEGNFDFIIESYKNRLPPVTNIVDNCINENNYCYIAQLYEKKNDYNSAYEYLQEPIKYFEQYDYVCLHTIDCYIKLAKHYQMIKNDKELTVNIYQRLIQLIKKNRSDLMLNIISIAEQHLINYLKSISDLDTTILIFETLCGIIRYETTAIKVLYNHLKRVLKLLVHKTDAFNAVLNVYNAFLNLILQVISPLMSQMAIVLTHFRNHSINAYKNVNELFSAIEIYETL